VLRDPTTQLSGSILKAESLLGSGSMALYSNLKGFSNLSKAKFLTISTWKRSPIKAFESTPVYFINDGFF